MEVLDMFHDSIKTHMTRAAVALAVVLALDGPAGAQVRKANFNGDEYGDLAIGAPGETAGSGAVHILYGTSAFGPHAYGNELLRPGWPADLPLGSTFRDFGAALAWGDFDNDTFTDLAVGMPGYSAPQDGWGNRGAVRVYYGRRYGGLDGADTQVFTGSYDEEFFGTSLAAGNFNGDEYMDLAIGVPQGSPFFGLTENWSDGPGGGEILVLYGGANRLSLTGADRRSQDSAGIPGSAERFDFFGFSLAAGDFGFGPEDDLAVGVPGENGEAGAVNIIYGSSWGGLTYANAQLLQQGSNGLAGGSESGDQFGFSLAAGDFSLNGYADLAVGSPGEDIGAPDVGLVHVLYGGEAGLDTYSGQAFGQDWGELDLTGVAGASDFFGWSLAAGNFGKDSAADLAIGSPGDSGTFGIRGGTVTVVYGSFYFARLIVTGHQIWDQSGINGGLPGTLENGDLFGYSLSAQDLGFGYRADLVIGVPGEGVNNRVRAGAVHVLFSTASGLKATNNQLWTQDSVTSTIAVLDQAEDDDHFGALVGGADASALFLALYFD
jgi:hypothetical protein